MVPSQFVCYSNSSAPQIYLIHYSEIRWSHDPRNRIIRFWCRFRSRNYFFFLKDFLKKCRSCTSFFGHFYSSHMNSFSLNPVIGCQAVSIDLWLLLLIRITNLKDCADLACRVHSTSGTVTSAGFNVRSKNQQQCFNAVLFFMFESERGRIQWTGC